jgi:hypothetical protein
MKSNPALLSAHNITLREGSIAQFTLMIVELRTFVFSTGPQSLSINNGVLGTIAKRLLFTMLNLLNPTGHVTHQQFNIQQLYFLPHILYLCVLYLSENKQRLVPLTE